MTTLGNSNGTTVQTTTLAAKKPLAGRTQGILSADKQAELVDRLKDGQSVEEVARAIGVGTGTIVRYAKSLGVTIEESISRPAETKTEDVAQSAHGDEEPAKKPRKARKAKVSKKVETVTLAPLSEEEQQLIGWLLTSGLHVDKAREALAAYDRWVAGAKPVDDMSHKL